MDHLGLRLLDDLPIAAFVAHGSERATLHGNRAFGELVGRSERPLADAALARVLYDAQGNPLGAERLPHARAFSSRSRVVEDVLVVRGENERRIPCRALAEPVNDSRGEVARVVVVMLDVTNEEAARAAHAALAARLKLIVDHAPLACWSADRDGIVTLSEGAALGPLGLHSGAHVGQSVFELYRDHPTICEHIRRGLAGQALWQTMELGERTFESWITPIRDESGAVTGVFGVANDVSEARKLQARAIQADRVISLGTLAASVAHEINNPLTYVLSYLEELEECLAELGVSAPAERARQALAPVQEGVRRIATITSDLRTFSRPDDRRHEAIDLRAVVESVLALMKKEIQARATLALSLDETRPVFANEARLVQVFLNLVLNAIQALPAGTASQNEISIRLADEGEHVLIEVSDSGPGVRLEDRERIFDPFVTTKPIGVGTGLGLFVCRNVVRALGGDITVGDRPGGGASFRVLLPAAARAEPPAPELARSRRAVAARVLIIDDDEFVSRSFAERLRAESVVAETELGAAAGLARLLDGQRFDLVYCDLMMNDVTGMDFAEELAARLPDMLERVVFMTGGAFTQRASEFVERLGDRCVDKPFDILKDVEQRLARLSREPA